MNCQTCDEICILISDECLCQYSPIPSINLKDNYHLVDAANEYIEQYTGECDLCEGFGEDNYQYQEIIDNKAFKRLYAAVIYAYWIRHNGAGEAKKAGFSIPQADEFSKFAINPLKENRIREDAQWQVVEQRLTKFKKLIEKTDCIKCEEPEPLNDCGCPNVCNCKKPEIYQSDSYSF